MPDVRRVSDVFSVADQVRPEEVAELDGRFAMLINNRPDGEEPGQPSASEIEAAAREAGLAYEFIPIAGPPTAQQVRAMREALSYSTGPALAFCRSGTRSVVTWALGEALAGRTVEDLQAEAGSAGYDVASPVSALLPRLQAELEAPPRVP